MRCSTPRFRTSSTRCIDGRPPREFGPVAVDPSGRVYLLDPRDNVLLIYDRSHRLVGNVRAEGKEARFVDVARSEDGGVYVLESRLKYAIELTQGKVTRKINLTRPWRRVRVRSRKAWVPVFRGLPRVTYRAAIGAWLARASAMATSAARREASADLRDLPLLLRAQAPYELPAPPQTAPMLPEQ